MAATNAVLKIALPSTEKETVGNLAYPFTCAPSGGAVCPASLAVALNATSYIATIPTLPPGGKLAIGLSATGARAYATATVAGRSYPVSATLAVAGGQTETIGGTDVSVVNVYVYTPRPNVSVIKSADRATANTGEQVTYTITVNNTGTEVGTLIDLVDSLSGTGALFEVPFSSCAASGGAVCPASAPVARIGSGTATGQGAATRWLHWPALTLAPGGTLTFSVRTLPLTLQCGTSVTVRNAARLGLVTVGPISQISTAIVEDAGANSADNTSAVVSTVYTGPVCQTSDIGTNITQPALQTTNGLVPNAPFS